MWAGSNLFICGHVCCCMFSVLDAFSGINEIWRKVTNKVCDYGENDQPENVKFKEPFPFHGEYSPGGYFNQEIFDKAAYCVVRGWNTAEKVSSKDSE